MTWQIDPTHSKVGFTGRHMMVAKVRGEFQEFAFQGEIYPDDFENSKATLKINVASIESGFDQRDNHLRSADFFDAETFPQLTFATTKIARTKGNDFKISGDLTIKDVTRPVVFEAEVNGPVEIFGTQKIGISAQTKINRKEWGLSWNMPLGVDGLLVSDEITLTLDAELADVA